MKKEIIILFNIILIFLSTPFAIAENHYPTLTIKVLDENNSKLIPYVDIAITCGGGGSHIGCIEGCEENKFGAPDYGNYKSDSGLLQLNKIGHTPRQLMFRIADSGSQRLNDLKNLYQKICIKVKRDGYYTKIVYQVIKPGENSYEVFLKKNVQQKSQSHSKIEKQRNGSQLSNNPSSNNIDTNNNNQSDNIQPSYDITVSFIIEQANFQKRYTQRHEVCPDNSVHNIEQKVNFDGSKMTVENTMSDYTPGCYIKFSNSRFSSSNFSFSGSYTINMSEVDYIKQADTFPFKSLVIRMKKGASMVAGGDTTIGENNEVYFYTDQEPDRLLKALLHFCKLSNAEFANSDSLFR